MANENPVDPQDKRLIQKKPAKKPYTKPRIRMNRGVP